MNVLEIIARLVLVAALIGVGVCVASVAIGVTAFEIHKCIWRWKDNHE